MPRRLLPLLALPLTAILGACNGSSSSGTPPANPADVLSDLAGSASAVPYSATYEFHQASSDQSATVKVWRAQPTLRVDVIVGTTTASLIVGPSATYSCAVTGKKRSCLTVAKAGQPLPAPFDVAPASLFTSDVQALQTNISDYAVSSAPSPAPSPGVPAARCFNVAPLSGASAATVPKGTYCFAGDGLLVAATYPSGNTVRLVSAQTATPPPGQFSPYASPTPLPTSTR